MRAWLLIFTITLAIVGCDDENEVAEAPAVTFVVTTAAGDSALEPLRDGRELRVFTAATTTPGSARDVSAEALAVLLDAEAGPVRLVALPENGPLALTAASLARRPIDHLVLIDPPLLDKQAVPAPLAEHVGEITTLSTWDGDRPPQSGYDVLLERLSNDPRLLGTAAGLALDHALPENAALATGDGPLWRLIGVDIAFDGGEVAHWVRLKAASESRDLVPGDDAATWTLTPGTTLELTPHRKRRMLRDVALGSARIAIGDDEPPTSVTPANLPDDEPAWRATLQWQRVTPIGKVRS